jgi:D-sedoheptulose 7-phosphate isomerase
MKNDLFLKNLNEHAALIKALHNLNNVVNHAGGVASKCLINGGKILLCGNGGSAADSQHLAAELTGRFIYDRRPLAAMALSTDTSALTCIGNDYSFDEIFARQVAGLGRAGDVLIGISTSGNSRNVIRAVEEAKKLLSLCDHSIVVPSDVTARIQECHILIGHTFCGLIENELGFA